MTYVIEILNLGPEDVMAAEVLDLLPDELLDASWECLPGVDSLCTLSGTGDLIDLVDMPAGSGVTYVLTAATDPTLIGVIENTASITSPDSIVDINPDNNTATDRSATDALFIDGFEDEDILLRQLGLYD